MNKKYTLILSLLILILGFSPAQATPVKPNAMESKYKSCSYPKSPAVVRPPNATSWKAQGFGDVVKGIDVSRWNHPQDKPIDFEKLKSEYGITFVIIKASDGGTNSNALAKKWYALDRKAALEQGLVVGAYHYALPGNLAANRTEDAKLQAARAVRQSGGAVIGDLPLTLDMEELPCSWTHAQLAIWTDVFLSEVKRLTGRTPIIYMNGTFINRLVGAKVVDLSGYPLWLAKWGPKNGTSPGNLASWEGDWVFWQFTADGRLKGVSSKNTDLNIFNGTKTDFMNFISR